MIKGLTILSALLVVGCSSAPTVSSQPSAAPSPTSSQPDQSFAIVTDVATSESQSGQYSFAVTVKSPDTGCEQYADWWEVLDESGTLLYRRILAHSHVAEQPFQRSGGPVTASADQVLIVRAHMNTDGYATQAMKGTIASGFQEIQLDSEFAATVATQDPQPNNCAG